MTDRVEILHGDLLEVLRDVEDTSVDAVVTDPPYGLGFMGKAWDRYTARDFETWCMTWAAECYRVLKPGGHLLAFGGTRTSHRLTAGIEDAGFDIRDQITWMYGSGFPKSLDVGKAIDKAAGATREVVGVALYGDGHLQRSTESIGYGGSDPDADRRFLTAPATPDAERWQGWGTALKPASEPIVVARKPLAGTVATNVLTHGTGALNIDGCRVGSGGQLKWAKPRDMGYHGGTDAGVVPATTNGLGRWPTNVVLSHASTTDGQDVCADGCVDGCPVAELDVQSGFSKSPTTTGRGASRKQSSMVGPLGAQGTVLAPGDEGGASRFYPVFRYQAKAPGSERPKVDGVAHPTVKPLALMRWLVRLVTPPGGLVLDPFAGSGTTGEAAVLEGMRAILVENEAEYLPLIAARLERVQPGGPKLM